MIKIKCLLIDDEPIAREIIEVFIEKTTFLELVGSFGKALDALEFLQNNMVDIILTDIEMPQISGLQLIKSLSYQPATIFITAYREFALEGFDVGIVDYLVKPVSYDRFLKAVNRAIDSLKKKNVLTEGKNNYIFIKSDNKFIKILFDDVVYIESIKDYLRIHISETQRFVTHSTMKSIAEKLPDYFFRIHRSYIVNTKFTKFLHGNTIQMKIGVELPISQSVKSDLFSKLGVENK
jgi:two-component system LytT family response regulator